MSEEQRLADLWVSGENVLECLACDSSARGTNRVRMVVPGLPEGYKVRAVYYDVRSNGWFYRLEHPSFDVVENGAQCPVLNHPVELRTVDIAPDIEAEIATLRNDLCDALRRARDAEEERDALLTGLDVVAKQMSDERAIDGE